MKPRLLYVVNTPWFFVSHRLVLAEAAREHGFDVAVLTPEGEGVSEIRERGFAWYALPLDRGGMNPVRDLGTIAALIRAYRALKPDVVHHVTLKPVIYGTLAAQFTGVPRVINAVSGMGFLFTAERRAKQWLGELLFRACLRHPQMEIIVQNRDDFALIYKKKLGGKGRLTIIPGSGVDTEKFRPSLRPRPSKIVLQTSRMLGDKGVREFAAAARILQPRYPDVRFVLVGDTDPGNPSSLDAAELEAEQRFGAVEWWGPRNDIEEVLAQASIYCLPSYREGLPKSLIEAAAAGLPLVTTDTSGCAEVVEHERNGLLVPVGDAAALASAIERLLLDPHMATRLGAAARQDAERRFAVGRIVGAQLALYRSPDLSAF